MPKFSEIEAKIISLFPIDGVVIFEGKEYITQICGKPRPSAGECKTDIYIELRNKLTSKIKVLKISVKLSNADFLENKMSYQRALEIFGNSATDILTKLIKNIEDKFKDDYLIYFERHRKTKAQTIKIGWKFELTNKLQGDKSGILELTEEQKLDIYSGTNLANDKKDSYVNGSVIENSGIAEYILIVDDIDSLTTQKCLQNIVPISTYIKDKNIYFACKAVNYRMSQNKWDGDRPLSVWVEWNIKDGMLTADLNMSNPLHKKANEIGRNLQSILKDLHINKNNFDSLEQMIAPNVKIYK